MSVVRIAIHGAAGRMGQRLVALGSQDEQLRIVACLEHPSHPLLGRDAGRVAGGGELDVPLASELTDATAAEIDVIIDFSVPEGVDRVVALAVQQRKPLVLATTGLSEAQQHGVREAARNIPLVWAPSMGLAVNLAMKLTSIAAAHLKSYGPGADVEIVERHHRFKEDAPSGTALRFGELVAAQLQQSHHVHGRHGRPGARRRDEIGYHALRTGDNPGEHTIVFGMMGETLEITVKATNRDCYAYGALAAAKFLINKSPGVYSMDDVFQL